MLGANRESGVRQAGHHPPSLVATRALSLMLLAVGWISSLSEHALTQAVSGSDGASHRGRLQC